MSDEGVSRALARAAREMHRTDDVDDVVEAIVRSARAALPAFEHIGVSTVERRGSIVSRASTSDFVLELDQLQYGIPEGPCYDVLDGADLVVAPHIRHEQRWPTYVPQAVQRGLRSQLAVRLHIDGTGTVGGLNLYSTQTDDLDEHTVAAAEDFATHASIALGRARGTRSLLDAVETRQQIGQAIGILMERYDLDEKAAHAFLWRASSHGNTKVRDLAASLIDEVNTRERGR